MQKVKVLSDNCHYGDKYSNVTTYKQGQVFDFDDESYDLDAQVKAGALEMVVAKATAPAPAKPVPLERRDERTVADVNRGNK